MSSGKSPLTVRARAALLLTGFLLAPWATALPEDRQQPIHVVADRAVQQNGTVTYTGDVVITQGSTRITGNEVVVQHVEGRVRQLDAKGDPATFRQTPEQGSAPVHGRGQHLIYFQTENRVELLQQAQVERGGNTVAGNRIEYLVDTETVRAEGSHADQPGRVEMVLQPENSGDAPPAAAATETETPTATEPASEAGGER
jgi:lipopolysaccharide export system protein LptA